MSVSDPNKTAQPHGPPGYETPGQIHHVGCAEDAIQAHDLPVEGWLVPASSRPPATALAAIAEGIRGAGLRDEDGCTLCIAEDAAASAVEHLQRAGFIIVSKENGA